jgi:hypothetical protein
MDPTKKKMAGQGKAANKHSFYSVYERKKVDLPIEKIVEKNGHARAITHDSQGRKITNFVKAGTKA